VEEGDVELEDLDELDDAAVRDVELAVEVEGARIGVGAVLGDLAGVDVTRELGGVLVLLVLGLEGTDADAVLLREDEALDPDVLDDPGPVALVLLHELAEDEAAGRAEAAGIRNLKAGLGRAELAVVPRTPFLGDEVERLFVHGARHDLLVHRAVGPLLVEHPVEGVEGAFRRLGIRLQALLQQAGDGRLGGADRPVQEDDASFGAVALGGSLEDVDELHQGNVEPVDGVLAAVGLVQEEVVPDELLLVVDVFGFPMGNVHVVQPLESRTSDLGVLLDDAEVVLEGTLPVQLLIGFVVLHRCDSSDQAVRLVGFLHGRCSSAPVLLLERAIGSSSDRPTIWGTCILSLLFPARCERLAQGRLGGAEMPRKAGWNAPGTTASLPPDMLPRLPSGRLLASFRMCGATRFQGSPRGRYPTQARSIGARSAFS